MMHDYKVDVSRDGRWWMIHVPEIGQLTQARRISEIEDMARSLIAISTDTPLTDIGVHITSIEVPELGDIAARAREIEAGRRVAVHANEVAQRDVADYAHALAKAGVPVRDAAALLHVSPQRVSQLARER
ncbi:HicB family toxin-antitoxin system [Mycobacterium sp.]|uniref:HicB family toxin-antitoxin system n=1 Tax=Mycobacterium sp. TaxID=1785 RepID=UPI003D6A5FEC